MNIHSNFWPVFCILINMLMICVKSSFIHDIVNFFLIQNDMLLTSLVVLSEDKECNKNDTLCVSLYNELVSRDNTIPFAYIKNYSDPKHNAIPLIDNTTSTLVVIPSFTTSVEIRSLFSNLSSTYLARNAWLICYFVKEKEDNYIQSLEKIFNNQKNFQFDSQVYVLAASMKYGKLFEVYRACENTSINIRHLKTFKGHVKDRSEEEFIWNRRTNLMHCQLRVAYVSVGSFREINKTRENTILTDTPGKHLSDASNVLESGGKIFRGIRAKMFKMLVNKFNFTIKWVHPKKRTFGVKDSKTGLWNGLVGLLANNEAHLSVLPMSVTPIRKTAINFASTIEIYQYRLFMQKPVPSGHWSTYIDVFDKKYWLILVAVVILCSVMLCAFFGNSNHQHNNKSKKANIFSWKNIGSGVSTTFLALGTIDVNAAENVSWFSPNSLRVLFIVVCACGMFNRYAYDAGLISYLMIQKLDIPITDLNDVLAKPEYELLVNRGGAEESFFSESLEKSQHEIWNNVQKQNNVIESYAEGEQQIKTSAYKVFFAESPSFENNYKSFPCDVISTDVSYGRHSGAYGLQNDLPYTKLFNHFIRHITETGLLPRCAECKERFAQTCSSGESYRQLDYDNISSAFAFSACGFVLAILVCLLECIYGIYLKIMSHIKLMLN